jgi:hypothetical protein
VKTWLNLLEGRGANLLDDLYWIEHSCELIAVSKQHVLLFVVNITVSSDLEIEPMYHSYFTSLSRTFHLLLICSFVQRQLHFILETK